MDTWEDLEFWSSPEWAKIQEQLDVLDRHSVCYNPDRSCLFASLDATSFADTKVCIVGQDPYPQHKYATGLAFSIPRGEPKWPSTLVCLLKEYVSDLNAYDKSYPMPQQGDLTPWAQQGVLLINAVPSCEEGKSLSHVEWGWNYLIQEILEKLSKKDHGVVFVLLGTIARSFSNFIDERSNPVIELSHPSPRAWASYNKMHKRRNLTWTPFVGSRMFTTINDKLVSLNYAPIDWRL